MPSRLRPATSCPVPPPPPRAAGPHLAPTPTPLHAHGIGPTPAPAAPSARPRVDVPALHLDGMDPPRRGGPHIPVPTLSIDSTCRPGHPVDEDERLPAEPPPAVALTPRGAVVGGDVVVRPTASMGTTDRYDGTPEGTASRERDDRALMERMSHADPTPGLPTVDALVDGAMGRRHIDLDSPEARSLDEAVRRGVEAERARPD